MRLSPLSLSLLCVPAGAVASLAMPPYGLWAALFVGLGGFYAVHTKTHTMPQAAWNGFFFGMGYFTAGLWWIGNALLIDGNDSWLWAWPLAVLGLPALLSLFTAGASAGARALANPATLTGYLAFCAAMSAVEWLRGHIFTGFPWNLYGYAWYETLSVAQTASLFGIYGLSLLTILWAVCPGFLLSGTAPRKHKAAAATVLALSAVLIAGYGIHRLSANPVRTHADSYILVVQPNIKQETKWDREQLAQHFHTLLDLSRPPANAASDGTTLILWPETALPPAFVESGEAQRQIASTLQAWPGEAFLATGALIREHPVGTTEKPLYYNSLLVYDAQGQVVLRYDKSHLVPFGEYIPFQNFIPLAPIVKFSGFQAGPGKRTLLLDENAFPSFSPLICYEILFPGAVTHPGTPPPEWIAAITNDGWYGDTPGPRQHFAQSIFRAIEEGLPVVRSANTGISGIIGPTGRIIAKTNVFRKETLYLPLPEKTHALLLYTATKDYLYFVFLTALFLAILIKKYKNLQ